MDRPPSQTANLEDQLRNMILSNVDFPSLGQASAGASSMGAQQPQPAPGPGTGPNKRPNHHPNQGPPHPRGPSRGPRHSRQVPQPQGPPIQAQVTQPPHLPRHAQMAQPLQGLPLSARQSSQPQQTPSHPQVAQPQVQPRPTRVAQPQGQPYHARQVAQAQGPPPQYHGTQPPQQSRYTRVAQPQGQLHQAGQVPQAPKILQRQSHATGPNNQAAMSQKPQYPPRQTGYQNAPHQAAQYPENPMVQVQYLDHVASQEIPKVEITRAELVEKEKLRKELEAILRDAVARHFAQGSADISLVAFGSLTSGFATPGSDMDLAMVVALKDDSAANSIDLVKDIPRLFEKAILDNRMGGRLLTRTRVPILKVCQHPSEALYTALVDERRKWDEMPEDEKNPAPPPALDSPQILTPQAPSPQPEPAQASGDKSTDRSVPSDELAKMDLESSNTAATTSSKPTSNKPKPSKKKLSAAPKPPKPELSGGAGTNNGKDESKPDNDGKNESKPANNGKDDNKPGNNGKDDGKSRDKMPWVREKSLGPLDFPKSGVGIQCDINFANPLGIENTSLLRCYSRCDPRVRPMVLFVKAWAKRRKINSSYSGTLSSYGWVLMVLHYLVNIASPPVCPNLQHCYRPPAPTDLQGLEHMFQSTNIGGYSVRFWRDEAEIMHAARSGLITQNNESLGALLRGFFLYYAAPPNRNVYGHRVPSFYWTTEVLSLRSRYGILSKHEKGWTGAKTTNVAGKEVRHRYLFAIEDPFELDHNVARTVTHHGIVAIRDEFRRAWRIISAVGRDAQPEGSIFDEVVEKASPPPTVKAQDADIVPENKDELDALNG